VDGAVNNVIYFGRTISSTGAYAAVSSGFTSTLNYFLDWVNNKQGGVDINGTNYKFGVKSYDDSSIDENIPVFYRVLAELDNVDFLIGPIGSVVQSVQQIAADDKKLLINLASPYIPGLGYNITYTLNYLQRGDVVLSTCFKTVVQQSTIRTAYIVGTAITLPYIELQLGSLLPYNVSIVGTDLYSQTNPDFTTLVQKWKAANPDVLIGGGIYDTQAFAKAIRLANWNPVIILIAQGTTTTPAMNYIFAYSVWTKDVPYSDPYFGTATDLIASYQAFYNNSNSSPSAGGVAAYLAIYLAIIATQSLDSAVIRDYILAANISTVYGPLIFDNTNSYANPPFCCQYQNLKFTIIAPADVRIAEPIFGKVPVLPPDCYPKSTGNTGFLLSVTLGTILPSLCLLTTVVFLVVLVIRKFDLILLPKQNPNNIDF